MSFPDCENVPERCLPEVELVNATALSVWDANGRGCMAHRSGCASLRFHRALLEAAPSPSFSTLY